MKTIKIVVIVLLCFGLKTKAQTNLDSLNMQLRALFTNLAKPIPPKLFNYDMAGHSLDSNYFVNINTADTVDIDVWQAAYTEMRNSAYDTIPLRTADLIIEPCYQFQPDTINMVLCRLIIINSNPMHSQQIPISILILSTIFLQTKL